MRHLPIPCASTSSRKDGRLCLLSCGAAISSGASTPGSGIPTSHGAARQTPTIRRRGSRPSMLSAAFIGSFRLAPLLDVGTGYAFFKLPELLSPPLRPAVGYCLMSNLVHLRPVRAGGVDPELKLMDLFTGPPGRVYSFAKTFCMSFSAIPAAFSQEDHHRPRYICRILQSGGWRGGGRRSR